MQLHPFRIIPYAALLCVTFVLGLTLFAGLVSFLFGMPLFDPDQQWFNRFLLVLYAVMVVFGLIASVGIYDTFATSLERLNALAARIRVALAQKLELVPEIQGNRDRFAEHELALVQAASEARKRVFSCPGDVTTVTQDIQIVRDLSRFAALAESHPSTSGSELFSETITQIISLDGEVRSAHDEYNGQVEKWNADLSTWNGQITGGILGIKKLNYLA